MDVQITEEVSRVDDDGSGEGEERITNTLAMLSTSQHDHDRERMVIFRVEKILNGLRGW